jgi:hypothetical protein
MTRARINVLAFHRVIEGLWDKANLGFWELNSFPQYRIKDTT